MATKEHLKGYALDFVNKLACEFGNPTIEAFTPGSLNEDSDTFTRACESAIGVADLMVCWGETDGEKSWLSFWSLTDDQAARAVDTEWQRVDDVIVELLEPPPIFEFGCGLLEGEFSELVLSVLDHQPSGGKIATGMEGD